MHTTYNHIVNGYELDSFGHVNNAVYLNYLEAARWYGFKQINAMDLLSELGLFPVIIETNIKYLQELKLFDSIIIETEWSCSDSIVENRHKIWKQGSNKKLVSKALCRWVLLSQDRVINDIPEVLKNIIRDI